MANRIANGAGTSFNTAANWDEGWTTPTVHASTSIAVTGAGVFSATQTAPNTANKATGVLVKCVARGTAGTIMATLQENSAGWVDKASATINITDLVASTDIFFKFTTPYTFASVAANYYRIKLNTTGASGTMSMAADSGAANFMQCCYMDSNAVPAAGDDIVVTSPNMGAALSMTLDSSPTFGSGTNTSVPTFRSVGNAIVVSNLGSLEWPTGSSRTATVKGNVMLESGGGLYFGRTTGQVPVGTLAKLVFDQNGTTANYGLVKLTGGVLHMQGASLAYNHATLASGVGTAADPAIYADAVDWSVGDYVVHAPSGNGATNYDETEPRYIIAKNSATSYVLSSTSGGAETALAYTHTGALCANLTRPTWITTTDPTKAWYMDNAEITTIGNSDFDGCRFSNWGSTTAGKLDLIFSNISTELFTLDDAVFDSNLAGFVRLGNNNDARTFEKIIFYDYNTTGNAGALFAASFRNKTWNDCHVIDSQSAGFFPFAAESNTFNDCTAWACGRGGATANGGFAPVNCASVVLNNCESHACRSYGIDFASMSAFTANYCLFGTKGYNGTSDVFCTSDGFVTAVLESCMFSSPTLIANNLNASPGSLVAFQLLNQTTNTHRWYSPGGAGYSVGSGLADTTTLKAGHLSARLDPEDTTNGMTFQTRVLATPGESAQIFGMIQKNAAMAADEVTVDLYLPGSLTPDDTYVMPTDTSVNVFTVAAPVVTTEPFFAKVVVTAKSVAVGAQVYAGNFYNGTDALNAFDLWYRGQPSDVMVTQAGDPEATWAVLNSTLTTAGTTGKTQADTLTKNFYLGTK